MQNWLKCKIFPGQFTGEYAVKGKLFNDIEYSLFVEKQYLEFSGVPTFEKPVEGWICVERELKKDDLLLVSLPQPTFENGQSITVKMDQVKD